MKITIKHLMMIGLTFICGKGCEDWVATVEALDEAIPELKKQGYVFVTVAQLFELLNCPPDGHTMYTVVPDGRE